MPNEPDQDEATFISPPGSLADKAKAVGNAGLDEAEMLRRAEEAVAALKDEYPQWVENHIVDLEEAYAKARAHPDTVDIYLSSVAAVAHEVKGEGTTYGYPLMTRLGESLHDFTTTMLENASQRRSAQFDIIEKHITDMRVVIRDRIEGDGGDLGQSLLASLEAAIAALEDECPAWAKGYIVDLEAAYAEACGHPDECDADLAALARAAYDVKGEGTINGYPLMTSLGDSLHRFTTSLLEDATQRRGSQFDIIAKHIEAMRVVIRDRIEGDGGELGQSLLASLDEAVARFSK